jgi:transposase
MEMADPPVRLFVGIDWATEEHEVCALRPDGEIEEKKSFSHSGDGLADLAGWLERLSAGHLEEVRVAIEVPHGAVVDTLLERNCQVFSINPKQLDRFRDRFSVAGAKDDRRDAYVLADSLRTDPHCFRHLQVEDPTVIQLREWSRLYDEIKHQQARETNRLRDQLRRYFPQYLELTDNLCAKWLLELWKRIPTPEEARKRCAPAVAKILRTNRVRRMTASQTLETLRKKPLSVAPGTVEAAVAHIRLVVDRLEVVNRQTHECKRKLDVLIEELGSGGEETDDTEKEEQRDAEILRSAPGVGRIVLATLLAEAADPLRRRDYHTLRALTGAAPVTKRSGKSLRVVVRRACHPRLRSACYHWARVATQRDVVCRERYASLRQRGKTHGRALRTIADGLLRMACSMLRYGTLYDTQRARGLPGSSLTTEGTALT